jgi:hypothetical protein
VRRNKLRCSRAEIGTLYPGRTIDLHRRDCFTFEDSARELAVNILCDSLSLHECFSIGGASRGKGGCGLYIAPPRVLFTEIVCLSEPRLQDIELDSSHAKLYV